MQKFVLKVFKSHVRIAVYFLSVTHFTNFDTFFVTHFSNCGTFSSVILFFNGDILLSVTHFFNCEPVFQLWHIFLSLTYFLNSDTFFKCNPIFPSVTHFLSVSHFFNCNTTFNCNLFLHITHYFKCDLCFQVRLNSKAWQNVLIWPIFPTAAPFFTSDSFFKL